MDKIVVHFQSIIQNVHGRNPGIWDMGFIYGKLVTVTIGHYVLGKCPTIDKLEKLVLAECLCSVATINRIPSQLQIAE